MEPQLRPPCSPGLTNFKHSSPCHTEQTKIVAFKENYQQPVNKIMLTAVMVDSQMVNCNRFGYQQAIPHSPFIASTSKVLCIKGRKADKNPLCSGLAKPFPSQYKSVKTDASMPWIKKSRSSLDKRHTGQEQCLAVNLENNPSTE